MGYAVLDRGEVIRNVPSAAPEARKHFYDLTPFVGRQLGAGLDALSRVFAPPRPPVGIT
jgi:hypothetical protein